MDELLKKFGLPAPADDAYGRGRDWNVDLIPKVNFFFHHYVVNVKLLSSNVNLCCFSVHYG